MTGFTKGPWEAIRNSSFWQVDPVNRGYHDPYTIGDVCASEPEEPDSGLQEANARLISAAPELYEALEDILTLVTPEFEESPMVAFAKAALDKANPDRGKTSV